MSGEVGNSGTVPYVDGLTELQAIAAAAGFTDYAQLSTVALLRREPSGTWRGYSLALDSTITVDDPRPRSRTSTS